MSWFHLFLFQFVLVFPLSLPCGAVALPLAQTWRMQIEKNLSRWGHYGKEKNSIGRMPMWFRWDLSIVYIRETVSDEHHQQKYETRREVARTRWRRTQTALVQVVPRSKVVYPFVRISVEFGERVCLHECRDVFQQSESE